MHRKSLLTLFIISLILLVVGTITWYTYTQKNDTRNSDATKNLLSSETSVYTDLEGNAFTFKSYEGKVRVVNSWASWTPFSVAELKDLELLATEYKDKDVVVLAVNRKEPKEMAKQFLSSIQEFSKIHFAIDITDAFYTSIGGFAMPETIFYDSSGALVFHKRGSMSLEEMRMYTEQAIAHAL